MRGFVHDSSREHRFPHSFEAIWPLDTVIYMYFEKHRHDDPSLSQTSSKLTTHGSSASDRVYRTNKLDKLNTLKGDNQGRVTT